MGRQIRILSLIILVLFIFSAPLLLAGCGGGGNGGSEGGNPPSPTAGCYSYTPTSPMQWQCNIVISITSTDGHTFTGGATAVIANPQ